MSLWLIDAVLGLSLVALTRYVLEGELDDPLPCCPPRDRGVRHRRVRAHLVDPELVMFTKLAVLIAKINVFIKNWRRYRKALGAAVGSIIAGLTAVLGLGVLAGAQASYVAAAIAFLAPIAAFLGSYSRKPNAGA